MSTYSSPSQIDILILRVSRERDAVYPFVSKLLILYRWKDHGEVRSLLLQFLSLVYFYCLFPPTRASSISVCSSCLGKCQTADSGGHQDQYHQGGFRVIARHQPAYQLFNVLTQSMLLQLFVDKPTDSVTEKLVLQLKLSVQFCLSSPSLCFLMIGIKQAGHCS